MKRRFTLKGGEGQAVVELAIALPVLLLLLCGIVDFGWMMGSRLIVNYCAREGARYATVAAAQSDSVSLVTARVDEIIPEFLRGGMNVDVVYSDPETPSDGDVTVGVSCKARALTPVGELFFHAPSVTLSADCVMKVE